MKIIIVNILALAVLASGKTASRELLDTEDSINRALEDAKDEIEGALEDARDGIEGFIASVWGKICLLDINCMKHVAYCDREGGIFGIGHCRPNIWVWLVLVVIAVSIMIAISLILCCCCVCTC